MNGTAIRDASCYLTLHNQCTALKHIKGKSNTFKSRNVKGDERKALAKSVEDMAFPSKIYHRRLAALDETSFKMGNLKNVPQSKNVMTQCKYENRKNNRVDDSIIVSLQDLKRVKLKRGSGFYTIYIFSPVDCRIMVRKRY